MRCSTEIGWAFSSSISTIDIQEWSEFLCFCTDRDGSRETDSSEFSVLYFELNLPFSFLGTISTVINRNYLWFIPYSVSLFRLFQMCVSVFVTVFSRLLALYFIVLMMHSLFSQLILQQRCPCPYDFNFNTLHYSHGMCIVCISVSVLSATHVTIIYTITL